MGYTLVSVCCCSPKIYDYFGSLLHGGVSVADLSWQQEFRVWTMSTPEIIKEVILVVLPLNSGCQLKKANFEVTREPEVSNSIINVRSQRLEAKKEVNPGKWKRSGMKSLVCSDCVLQIILFLVPPHHCPKGTIQSLSLAVYIFHTHTKKVTPVSQILKPHIYPVMIKAMASFRLRFPI